MSNLYNRVLKYSWSPPLGLLPQNSANKENRMYQLIIIVSCDLKHVPSRLRCSPPRSLMLADAISKNELDQLDEGIMNWTPFPFHSMCRVKGNIFYQWNLFKMLMVQSCVRSRTCWSNGIIPYTPTWHVQIHMLLTAPDSFTSHPNLFHQCQWCDVFTYYSNGQQPLSSSLATGS